MEHLRSYTEEVDRLGNDQVWRLSWAELTPTLVSIRLIPTSYGSDRLAAIVGDVISNSRAALDHIVTALADASGVQLSTRHQFPIYTSEEVFEKHVVGSGQAVKNGNLTGITVGLEDVRKYQPFERDSGTPDDDLLAVLNRLSNADKHRQLLGNLAAGTQITLCLQANNGQTLEESQTYPPDKTPMSDHSLEIAQVVLPSPDVKLIAATGTVNSKPMIYAPSFPPTYPLGHAYYASDLNQIVGRVGDIVEQFGRL